MSRVKIINMRCFHASPQHFEQPAPPAPAHERAALTLPSPVMAPSPTFNKKALPFSDFIPQSSIPAVLRGQSFLFPKASMISQDINVSVTRAKNVAKL
jgi:hypothetical protein